MTVHILRNEHYAVIRCNKDDEEPLREALEQNGYECGKTREVLDIPSLVDINIKRDGSWENIGAEDLRAIARNAGLTVAGE